jgi:HK97 family phage major capsid protein
MNRKERRDALVAKAKAVAEKAQRDKRELTGDEQQELGGYLTEIKTLNEELAAEAESKLLLGQLDAMAAGGQGLGQDGRRLAFGKAMAGQVVNKIRGEGLSAKAVAPSGAATVDQEFTRDPVAMGMPAVSLLSVLPVKKHTMSPAFAYLRQSVRDNAAAVVAEGDTKPTSVYSVEKVEGQLDVIAHLSEPIPRYWVIDNDALQTWLSNELGYGLMVAVEAMSLAAIAGTSGIQSNAYVTSELVTLRKSLTLLEAGGYDPAAFVLAPADWEAVELALSTSTAVEYRGLPYDPVTRRLYGVPVVVSNAATVGTAHTLAAGAAGIDTDSHGVAVQWSETSNDTDWAQNMIRARCEGRFATSVFTPFGVVQSTLTDD